jgi:hypothetical protein
MNETLVDESKNPAFGSGCINKGLRKSADVNKHGCYSVCGI